MNALALYRLSVTRARLLGVCPRPSNDNFLGLVVGYESAAGAIQAAVTRTSATTPTPSPS